MKYLLKQIYYTLLFVVLFCFQNQVSTSKKYYSFMLTANDGKAGHVHHDDGFLPFQWEKENCIACGGSGKCRNCGGSGKERNWAPGTKEEYIWQNCYKCAGSGTCRDCYGTGKQ